MVSKTTPVCDFGAPAPPFSLLSTSGDTVSIDDCRGPRGLLVMFISNHCPYVKAIREKLVRDCKELQEHGIASVAIMSNDAVQYPEDSLENMQRVTQEYDFPFPYLIDESQKVARAYGAVCTPDFFGYNADLELQYRGRLDAAGRLRNAWDEVRELFIAMCQVAETGQGPRSQFASIGCSIKWKQDQS